MGVVVIKKGIVIRLLQHLKPVTFSDPNNIYFETMKALADVYTDPLVILFDMFLWQSKLQRDLKDAIISPVYKARSRALVSN